jgi:SAM-dependent methyltransferase
MMIHNENAIYLVKCWESSIRESNLITDELQAVRWDKRAEYFGKDSNEERREKKTAEFFELLYKAGFSPDGAKVLDIGCGTGSLSIPLAQAGAEVTSLDISNGMLGRLKESAENKGLHMNLIKCSWGTADIDILGFRNAFDLVIASVTPGIKDLETFDRMMACSKKYCYYSDFIRKYPDKIPGEIYIKILGEAPQNNIFASGFLYPFMYLYTLGYYPMIQINHTSVSRKQDWDKAAEKAIDYLELTHDLSDEVREKIMVYYRKASADGIYNADYEMYSAMMVWSVDTPGRQV